MSQLLDLIFPKRCIGCKKIGSYLCPECISYISFNTVLICPICNKGSIDGATHPICKTRYCLDGLSSSIAYKGIVKKLIYQFKYKPFLVDLKEVIGDLFYEGLIQNESFYSILSKNPVLASVPLHRKKLRQRGYNHASVLGKGLAERFNLKFIDNILIREKETKPQFSLKKEERYQNIKGAFSISKKDTRVIKDRKILLVDDVATTCSTLNECAKVLKRNGAELVWGITFARE